MVFYHQTELNNNITLNDFVKYVKTIHKFVPIKMLTATKSLYSDIDGY